METIRMNPQQQNRWKSELLRQALSAFASDEALRKALIFKGARILSLRLGDESRQSLDIDSNMSFEFQHEHDHFEEQRTFFKDRIKAALQRFFGRQEPVRYFVESVEVEIKPRGGAHPFGWSGLLARIRIRDGQLAGTLGLPAVEVDVAAPEELGPNAISDLTIQNALTIRAYTLERIAGEKMRAFLSSLPNYIQKIGRRTDNVRVKDLYDMARIRRARPITDLNFWKSAGNEFQIACKSRCVDCLGLASFQENLETTREMFQNDQTLPKDIAFDEVLQTLVETVGLFEKHGIVPFEFPLPH